MEQLTIFDMMYPKYKITKPIRLIEFFAGYGSQALALKYLGVQFEHWKICEWAVKSIQAYKDIHFSNTNDDWNKNFNVNDIREHLYNLGISSNYNDPMTREQIKRLSEEQIREIHNNICNTNNLVNIQQVKGKDLEIEDTDEYAYILTYSFPCQDLSLAGKGKGMSDTSTRSGMLWEVERILSECYELGTMPQILLMENVPQVHGTDNVKDFNKWQLRLEELGYKNYMQDLIATDYGIPQTRNRCFMVSILGDYNYTFPKPIPLKLKLKDMLEDNVDKKYYLSDKMIKFFTKNEQKQKENGNGFRFNVSDGNVIAKTITTLAGNRMDDNFILTKDTENYIEWEDGKNIQMNCRAWKDDKVVATLNTGGETKILIKNATKQGYLEATNKDNVDMCVGTYQYSKSDKFMQGKDIFSKNNSTFPTLRTSPKDGIVNSNLRIRKLTPRECFRLMGVKDEDYEKCAKNQSDSSLYHLAGDSIVVNVLMAIFKELL